MTYVLHGTKTMASIVYFAARIDFPHYCCNGYCDIPSPCAIFAGTYKINKLRSLDYKTQKRDSA